MTMTLHMMLERPRRVERDEKQSNIGQQRMCAVHKAVLRTIGFASRDVPRESIYNASIPSSASAKNGCGSAGRKPSCSGVTDLIRSIRK